MKNLIHHARRLALFLLLALLAFAATSVAQGLIADPLGGPPDLPEESRAETKNTTPAASGTAATGYNFQALYSFGAASNDGTAPVFGLFQDGAGNLYGTTLSGGANGSGTVFKVDSTGKESVLYSFCSAAYCADGDNPWGSLIQDLAGNLYGTAERGGADAGGVVFKLAPPAQLDGNWTETIIYSFCSVDNCGDGEFPFGGLTQDSAGNLYGTAAAGGPTDTSNGTVFKLAPPAQPSGNWTETTLFSFCATGNCVGGASPYAGVIQDATGNLYGTTSGGGNDYGTVFGLAPPTRSGDNWTEATLYSFSPTIPINVFPTYAGLIRDSAGNLYGTTLYGGTNGGAVFKLAPPTQPGGDWTETVLYGFCSAANCTDGAEPQAGLIQDAEGNLYGTTMYGGANTSANNGYGGGTVFKLAPPAKSGGSWTETVLYSFCSADKCADGTEPQAALIQNAAGNLYGTTIAGGANTSADNGSGGGTVFKLTPAAQTKTETTLSGSPNPSTYGQAVVFIAIVAPAPPNGETVTFMNGESVLGTGTLSSGSATFTTSTLKAGTTLVTAVYDGDSDFEGSKSKAVKQAVDKATTSTKLTSSANPSIVGESVTFTATVAPEFSGRVTGKVAFYDGTTLLKSVALSGGETAYTASKLTAGKHSMTAKYGGSADFTDSSASLKQIVN